MFYRYNQYSWDPNNNQPIWQGPIDYHMMDGKSDVLPGGAPTHHQLGNEPFPYKPNYYPVSSYPGPFYNQLPQPPIYTLLSYFHDDKGKFDVNKMVSTFGQITNTVKQVSPLVKSFGSFLAKIQ